jgi:hypothetical protein
MKRIVTAFLFGLNLWACGSAFDSGTTTAQACDAIAQARCTRLAACSTANLQIRFGDEASCEAREKLSCTNSLAAPGNGSSPTHIAACAQAIATWDCTNYLNGRNVPTACQQQTGSLATGAACAVAGQCQTGFCAIPPTAACGVCANEPALGASCAELSTCGPSVVCTTDTQTCVVLGAMGEPCGKGAPCGTGLSCVGADATTGAQGTCQPAGEMLGVVCDSAQTLNPNCDRNGGFVCNSKTKQCAALSIASGGEPCGDVGSQNAPCGTSGLCVGASGATPGACVAAAADGAPCDTEKGPPCLQLARCVLSSDAGTSGTCQVPDATLCH